MFWDDVKFVSGILLTTIVILGLIVGLVVGIVTLTEQKYCEMEKELSPQLEFRWEFWGGCLIHLPDGTWAYAHDWLNSHRLELQQP